MQALPLESILLWLAQALDRQQFSIATSPSFPLASFPGSSWAGRCSAGLVHSGWPMASCSQPCSPSGVSRQLSAYGSRSLPALPPKSTLCPRPRAPGQLSALPLLIPAPRVPRPSAALTSELPTAPPAQRDHLSLCILAGAQSVSPEGDVGSPVCVPALQDLSPLLLVVQFLETGISSACPLL